MSVMWNSFLCYSAIVQSPLLQEHIFILSITDARNLHLRTNTVFCFQPNIILYNSILQLIMTIFVEQCGEQNISFVDTRFI